MSKFVIENLRLKELILVVNKNKPFFDEFVGFLKGHGYTSIFQFLNESDRDRRESIIRNFFQTSFDNVLYDGIARPYPESKSKWFFITWLLRDAPQQRLQPMMSSFKGTLEERRVFVISKLIDFLLPLLPDEEQWEWPSVAEVMLQRLEGSRRALKGNLFEAIVRTQLKEMFKRHNLNLKVTDIEVRINDETYDVEVRSPNNRILLPVKTRETMGGGHALLFTRDIHKSISVAHENGFNCIPVVIAESWGGNLADLPCDSFILIQLNPNQVDKINPILEEKLEEIVDVFRILE